MLVMGSGSFLVMRASGRLCVDRLGRVACQGPRRLLELRDLALLGGRGLVEVGEHRVGPAARVVRRRRALLPGLLGVADRAGHPRLRPAPGQVVLLALQLGEDVAALRDGPLDDQRRGDGVGLLQRAEQCRLAAGRVHEPRGDRAARVGESVAGPAALAALAGLRGDRSSALLRVDVGRRQAGRGVVLRAGLVACGQLARLDPLGAGLAERRRATFAEPADVAAALASLDAAARPGRRAVAVPARVESDEAGQGRGGHDDPSHAVATGRRS
ncbi:hypothetical protein ACU61A_15860 [Pseudonocardia sichuanensis]